MNKILFILLILAVTIRLWFILPANIIIGFDQVRDLTASWTIFKDGDIKIIGPTAGNNTDLHHGIAYLYFILPPLMVFNGSPITASIWQAVISAGVGLVLYYFALLLFKSKKVGLIAIVISSFSYYLVSYSGWLSNPSPTLLTVPLFFYFLWRGTNGMKYGLALSSLFLGLSIQFELFFLYLIPIFLIWLVFSNIFKSKINPFKELFLSLLSFLVATSTMVLTEIKYNFSGVKALLAPIVERNGSGSVSGNFNLFLGRYIETFDQTLFPGGGTVVITVVLTIFLFNLITEKNKKSLIFLTLYLISPALMILMGYHGAPWFLIGLPPAIILVTAYLLSKIRSSVVLVTIILLLFAVNINILNIDKKDSTSILEPDKSAILAVQLKAVDLTYVRSNYQDFTINSATNPLYINALWDYHYIWYGKRKYGFAPTWSGGDQLYPYNNLLKATGEEKMVFMIMDDSGRIPLVHKILAKEWITKEVGTPIEHDLGGIIVWEGATK